MLILLLFTILFVSLPVATAARDALDINRLWNGMARDMEWMVIALS